MSHKDEMYSMENIVDNILISLYGDRLEKEMATHSSPLAWKIPWTEEPGRLQSLGLPRVRHKWTTSLHSLLTLSLEKEMATHSSILAWRIPWTEEPGGPWSRRSQRVGHDWSDWARTHVIVIKPGILTPAHTHTQFQIGLIKDQSKAERLLLATS